MFKLTPANGNRERKRCTTPLCTCKVSRRSQGDARCSPRTTGGTWERQARASSSAAPHRPQWAYKPSEGDLAGKQATRAERKALRKRYLQERPHDGKPAQFPK